MIPYHLQFCLVIIYRLLPCIGSLSATPPHYDVVIVGGSVAGLATAVGLPNENVCIVEKATKFRQVGALIVLFPNGITALENISVDLKEHVMKNCVKLESTQVRNVNDNVVRESPAIENSNSRFLLWYELQECLIHQLSNKTTIKLGCNFRSATNRDDNVLVEFTNGSSTQTVTCRALVGADGIHSRVRSHVGIETLLRFHNRTIFRGILGDNFQDGASSPPMGVAVTYRGDGDGKFFKLWNANGKLTFTSAYSCTDPADVTDPVANTELLRMTFENYPIDLDKVTPMSIYTNHICDRDLPDWEQWTNGRIVLIGDAAHSMVPALGQGGNIALEDGCELSGLLRTALTSHEADVPNLLRDFSRIRHQRIQKIHQASRVQTRNKRNTKQAPLDQYMAQNPSFYRELYNWEPHYRS